MSYGPGMLLRLSGHLAGFLLLCALVDCKRCLDSWWMPCEIWANIICFVFFAFYAFDKTVLNRHHQVHVKTFRSGDVYYLSFSYRIFVQFEVFMRLLEKTPLVHLFGR